ncbi:MAG: sigma-70 family RNA polymerase sigma factor [Prevotella sp.]|nr:sigma-70 family RNA polymerase sigma factor [Prevotella sp.]
MNQKRAAIEQLFLQHYVRLRQLATRLLHDDEEGKDIVNDVFTRMIQADIMPLPEKAEAYLFTSVRNRCMDHIAQQQVRQRVERLLPVNDVTIPSETDEERRYSELRQFVDTELSEQTRQVFLLRFDKHKKYQEIAAELGVSEKTVYKHLHQAITQLHEHFKEQEQ